MKDEERIVGDGDAAEPQMRSAKCGIEKDFND